MTHMVHRRPPGRTPNGSVGAERTDLGASSRALTSPAGPGHGANFLDGAGDFVEGGVLLALDL